MSGSFNSEAEIEEFIISEIKRAAHPKAKIDHGSELAKIGFDSLDAIEVYFNIEEKFNIRLPMEAAADNISGLTVGEIISTTQAAIKSKAA